MHYPAHCIAWSISFYLMAQQGQPFPNMLWSLRVYSAKETGRTVISEILLHIAFFTFQWAMNTISSVVFVAHYNEEGAKEHRHKGEITKYLQFAVGKVKGLLEVIKQSNIFFCFLNIKSLCFITYPLPSYWVFQLHYFTSHYQHYHMQFS